MSDYDLGLDFLDDHPIIKFFAQLILSAIGKKLGSYIVKRLARIGRLKARVRLIRRMWRQNL